jgi:NADH-quinone oxidoreductase subunit L
MIYNALVALSRWGHGRLITLQTGELRWYATSLVFGLVLLLAIMLRNAS